MSLFMFIFLLRTHSRRKLETVRLQKKGENLLAKATRQHRTRPRIVKMRNGYL